MFLRGMEEAVVEPPGCAGAGDMELIGLMDSPFVRRVAVTAHLHGLALRCRPLSVYQNTGELSVVNSLMTVPVLVMADGRTLIDSSCICEYLDDLAQSAPPLMPAQREARANVKQVVARAGVACEKVGQLYREWALRPQHFRWSASIERMRGQIYAGVDWLDRQLAGEHYVGAHLTHADVMAAITLTFVRYYAELLELRLSAYPGLSQLTRRLENLDAFLAYPLD